ncbi:MAG: 3-deoxy-7-phosphoheptulonate synthase [Acidobacteria bacterium]|nr:3-deoxy-7-phosphoheptulonate synthase [Acidobacteriota bacterium]
MLPTQDLNIVEFVRLSPPRSLKAALPMNEECNRTVVEGRTTIQNILLQQDSRLLVVVGPCSIHEVRGALAYAEKLAHLRRTLNDRLYIVMRVYFEKPRTTIGWKGLINDPHLDGSYDIETGLQKARRLLLEITRMGLPTATEFLDPIVPQYISDLVSWAAIGARTTESQTHREMASGLSMPVGFKNATDGGLQIALDALQAARAPHSFLGIDQDGFTTIVRTKGNRFGHVVLRGGRGRTNYDADSINDAIVALQKAGQNPSLMVDCSHANANKQHAQQERVARSLIAQRAAGNRALIGLMLESFLEEGNQSVPANLADLQYGVSITDACLSWPSTERILRYAYEQLAAVSSKP